MDISADLQAQVKQAIADKTPLTIHGGKSKTFYGNFHTAKASLDMTGHSDIISYEPSELVVRVRAGMPLIELEQVLTEQQQIMPFEPPIHSYDATIGGIVAAGLSGPRRPFSGSIRDAVLGMTILTGKGEILEFGGQVMKNVAGYDVSRLMVGSLGTLGVILDVSLKLIPKPECNITHAITMNLASSLDYFLKLRDNNQPITATCHFDKTAYIRYSGSQKQMQAYLKKPEDGMILSSNNDFWNAIRNQTHPFFENKQQPLWRFLLPVSASLNHDGGASQLVEWNGGQRWLKSKTPTNVMIGMAKKNRGHLTLFRGQVVGASRFTQPQPELFTLYKALKNKLDPHRIFNPGRMYEEL